MHRELLLQKTLKHTLHFMHQKRQQILFEASNALLGGAKLTLTSLGRGLSGGAKPRHQIRKMDRLLGNLHLQQERLLIYAAINQVVIRRERPVISVDWSCLSYADGRYLLRASFSLKGRSFVCYEEVHPKAAENNAKVHAGFLENLQRVLPMTVKPIIVTDAIFSVLWFKKVQQLGWDFIGRIRKNRGNVFFQQASTWLKVADIFTKVQQKPQYFGVVQLTKRHELSCHLVGYKKIINGRKKKNRKGTLAKGSYNAVMSQSIREPWLLVTSLPISTQTADDVIQHYAKRMQIEEVFRDTKCARYGFGLNHSGTKQLHRVAVLLIINLLATFLCWLLACWTIRRKQHTDFHANSCKRVNVLSVITLGKACFRRYLFFSSATLKQALDAFFYLFSTLEFLYD